MNYSTEDKESVDVIYPTAFTQLKLETAKQTTPHHLIIIPQNSSSSTIDESTITVTRDIVLPYPFSQPRPSGTCELPKDASSQG